MSTRESPRTGNPGASEDHLDNPNDTRSWLYALAAHGLKVFPLVPGSKRPMVPGWESKATFAPAALDGWPTGAGIGVACGPSNLVVVDCDNHGGTPPREWDRPGITNGLDAFADLWSRHTPGLSMFGTFTVSTPSGGMHLYYHAPAGSRLRNTAGKLAWQVDTRAGGGYAVIKADLSNGVYTATGTPGDIAPLPRWLAQALTPQAPAQRRLAPLTPPTRTQADRRVAGLLRTVAAAPEGQRNSTLNWAAFQLAQDGLLTQEYATALLHAAESAGLPPAEAIRTIRSAAAQRRAPTSGATS